MKNLKNQKGITLVALVVTIIVLLILAGVSLSLVAGSNGIMTKAVKASDRNDSGTGAEQAELKIAELQAEYYEKYYVDRDSAVMGKSQTEYIEEAINNASTGLVLANNRYKIKIVDSKIVVYVTVGSTDRAVAEREYVPSTTTPTPPTAFTWANTAGYWTLKDVSSIPTT